MNTHKKYEHTQQNINTRDSQKKFDRWRMRGGITADHAMDASRV